MIQAPDPDRNRLLGFVIQDRPSSVGALLPVDHGITVLYGLNGAGKTRAIKDIELFWSGVRSNAVALIQLASRPRGVIDWFRETSRADWYRDWAVQTGIRDQEDFGAIVEQWVRDSIYSEDGDGDASIPLPSQHPHRDDGLRAEWGLDRLILVRAGGSVERPEWFSGPAVVTGPDRPFANEAAAAWEVFNRDEDVLADQHHVLNAEQFALTPDGRTILATAVLGVPVTDWQQAVYSAGRHDQLLELTPRLQFSTSDLDGTTRDHLRTRVTSQVEVVDSLPRPSVELLEAVEQLEAVANHHYQAALQDAPTLRLHVGVVGLDAGVAWSVEPDDRVRPETPRSLGGLSRAQSTWAKWSIQEALNALGPRADEERLLLLDEPEAALHRSAEERLVGYLAQIATSGSASLLVATHSPELLDFAPARLYEVARRGGMRQVTPLPAIARETLEQLGLLPSDLLRRQRGILLVEGEHDRVVLESLFAAELRHLRVEVLPLRGTHQLSPAKISFLFDFTPAHIFVMLDNVRTAELHQTWCDALDLIRNGDREAAVALLDEADCLRGDSEGRTLRQLLQSVVESGHGERLTPHGLSHADVIEYLPVDEFVPGTESWQHLRSRHQDVRAHDRQAPRDFKAWLQKAFQADVSPENVQRVTTSLDSIPADLLRLLKTLEANVSRDHL